MKPTSLLLLLLALVSSASAAQSQESQGGLFVSRVLWAQKSFMSGPERSRPQSVGLCGDGSDLAKGGSSSHVYLWPPPAVLAQQPLDCPVYSPVCGVDGAAYPNSCACAAAGVAINPRCTPPCDSCTPPAAGAAAAAPAAPARPAPMGPPSEWPARCCGCQARLAPAFSKLQPCNPSLLAAGCCRPASPHQPCA